MGRIKKTSKIKRSMMFHLNLRNMQFADPQHVIAEDVNHSQKEKRYYCFGKVRECIITVRFTFRGNVIRIIGAGYWRKGRRIYGNANKKN